MKAFGNLPAVNGISIDVGLDDVHIKSTGTKFLLKQSEILREEMERNFKP